MTIGRCTRFISDWPKVLGKKLALDSSGKLVKSTSGNFSRGRYVVESFDSPDALIKLLTSFAPNEALTASLPRDSATSGTITTKSALTDNPGAKARTKEAFSLLDAPSLGIIDIDDATVTLEQARDEIIAAAPALVDATIIGWYSGSSLIFRADECLSPAKGLRLYIPIKSGADWPRALKVLNARLAIRGHFRCIVASSGAILKRPMCDEAMGDGGARLDFAPAGSIVESPLEQRRPPPLLMQQGIEVFFDSQKILELTAAERSQFDSVLASARESVRADAEAKRAIWREGEERKAIAEAAATGKPIDSDEIRAQVRRTQESALHGQLMPDFELIHVGQDGREHPVKVAELLKDPKRWHRQAFLCPMNPEHRNRSADAITYLDQPAPVVYDLDSHTAFKLVRQQIPLRVAQGDRALLASQIAEHLRQEPDVFQLAGQLVLIPPRGAQLDATPT